MATNSDRRSSKQVVLPSRLYGASSRGGVGRGSRLYGASSRGGVGRGRGDGGRDRGKLVIRDGERVIGGGERVRGGGERVIGGRGKGRGDVGRDKGKVVIRDGERVIGGGERGRGDGGRDKGKGKMIGEKRKGDGGRGRVYVDESDSDYECEDERLEESDDEIEGGEEAEGYDGMEVEDDMEDEDDMEGEDEMGAEYTFERSARSVCYGDYKTPPKKGDPKLGVVEFIDDKTILQPKYKRTLKGILRAEWTYDTAFEKGRQREAFLNRCVKKFRHYYYYPKGYTKAQANSVVREHLRRNMKQNMFIMKKNATREVENALKKGENKKRHDFKPQFLEEEAWIGCCDYWETGGHKKMSKINTENRKQLTFPHASGAKPFEERRVAKEKETGEVMSELELFNIVYTKKHAELIRIQEAMERAAHELDAQHGPDDPPLSPASQRKRNILIALHARDPKKGRIFMRPRHTIYELLGYEEAALWTNLSTPARIPEHAYEMMGRALNEVTDMVQAMDGIEEVPRSRLDEELQKLADGAYPSKDDPTQRILWDQYLKIATHLTASLFGRFKKVVVEDTQVHDEGNGDRNDMANDEGNVRQNCDDEEDREHNSDRDREGSFNNVPLSP